MDTQNFEDGALHKPKEGKARRTESPMYWKEWMDECGQVALLMAKLDWMRSGEDDDIGELMSMLRDLVEVGYYCGANNTLKIRLKLTSVSTAPEQYFIYIWHLFSVKLK